MSRTHSAVEEDIRTAWLWYLKESLRAAENFEADVRAAFAVIEEGPERWPLSPLGVRRYKLKRFPYSVLYVHEAEGVFFLAIAHGNRGPGFWMPRLRDPR